MNKELPSVIHSIQFNYPLWTILPLNQGALVIECRNESDKTCHLYKVDLNLIAKEPMEVNIFWFDKLIGIINNQLFLVSYPNVNDPSIVETKKIDYQSGEVSIVDHLPAFNIGIIEPQLFEIGSDYFQKVVEFLAVELALSCEYLEYKDHIIISYYLRSEDSFDRFLLLIHKGKKKWKICQDHKMKGFSSGSFFVVENRLVFVKDRNEVCFYNL